MGSSDGEAEEEATGADVETGAEEDVPVSYTHLKPVGERGSICHTFCPAFFRKSMNTNAGLPNEPMP